MLNYILFLIGAVVIFRLLVYFVKVQRKSGLLVLDDDEKYTYELGNDLSFSNGIGNFAGMQISIARAFPHIYLDSHLDSKTIGPRYTFSNTQRLQLEGDFNNYFQLFVPDNFQNLALSILSPDVMQTLVQTKGAYDIEINHHFINIISEYKIYGKNDKETEIIKIARLLLKEISYKQKSWSEEDETAAITSHLKAVDDQSIRIFKRYYTLENTVVFFSILIGLSLDLLSFAFWRSHENTAPTMLMLGVLFFPGVFLILEFMKRR